MGEEQGWQDIASAPKDGTRIIASYGWDVDPEVEFIAWQDGAWWSDGDHWRQHIGIAPHLHSHWTHWMPLPSPPEPGK